MPFWMTVLLFVGFTVLGELLRPKPKLDAPRPAGLGDFNFPTATSDRVIPVVWGRCKIEGPNIVWYGALETVPITERVKTGLFTKKTITKGYRYTLGVQAAICMGEVDQVEVLFDGKVAEGDTLGWDRLINDPALFGGDTEEGGVAGMVSFWYGSGSTLTDSFLEDNISGRVPAYKDVCYAVFRGLTEQEWTDHILPGALAEYGPLGGFGLPINDTVGRGFYWGTTRYPKAVSFIVDRFPNQLGLTGGKELVTGQGANPACMLYEALTVYLAVPSANINVAGFRTAGNTLFTEGTGLSMVLDRPMTGVDFINEVLRHIDAVLYTDPATGQWELKLIRDDYTVGGLPEFTEDNTLEVEFSRGSWTETKNTVQVSYIDADNGWTHETLTQQDLANIRQRNGEVSVERIDYRGFSSRAAANRAAARALKTLSYPLAKATLVVNRDGWQLRPGSAFRLTWPDLGIADMVMRVSRISYGELDNGRITIEAVEDVFAVEDTAYSAPDGTTWTDPLGPPDALVHQRLVEAPYYLLGAEERRIMVMGVRENGTDLGMEVWTDTAGGTEYQQTNDMPEFTPSGTLTAALAINSSESATSFTVASTRDLKQLRTGSDDNRASGSKLLMVGNELMAWRDVTNNGDGTYTISAIWRAVLDTVQQEHSLGARVWFLSDGVGLTQEDAYGGDLTLTAKLLPYSTAARLAMGDAAQLSVTTASRAWRPYPPGKVRVNAVAYPGAVYGDATLTWAHRNRLAEFEARTLYPQDASDHPDGPEGTYTVQVYVGGVLKQTYSGLTGTSQAYTAAQRAADDTDGTKAVRFRITPVNGAISGTVRDVDTIMTGLGMTLGQYLGGLQG